MDHLEENVYRAWLAGAMIQPDRAISLLEAYGSAEALYAAWQSRDGNLKQRLTEGEWRQLTRNAVAAVLEQWRDVISGQRIQSWLWTDPDYPPMLREIADPPPVLFRQGSPEALDRRMLAMVGSRNASWDGIRSTRRIAQALSRAGVTIVSGLATGIDGAAHEGCLEGRSPTVAVMGCGLDRVYPTAHRELKERILAAGGLFLSEFAPGESPAGWHFPVRNRIISGLCPAVVLMEAKIRSGSMTTVRHALDQGRDVFVWPGDPSSPLYEGNHQLLREGAIYFTRPEELLEDLGWLDKEPEVVQNTVQPLPEAGGDLPPVERHILAALERGKLGFEELCMQTGLEAGQLMAALTTLQIRGRVETLPGKMYRLRR